MAKRRYIKNKLCIRFTNPLKYRQAGSNPATLILALKIQIYITRIKQAADILPPERRIMKILKRIKKHADSRRKWHKREQARQIWLVKESYEFGNDMAQDYHRGVIQGMELALSILENREPELIIAVKK